MWIPTWLGETYSKLYTNLKCNLFTFQAAKSLLSFNENKLAVAFSKLHSNRILLIYEARKPRLYRLLDPENFFLLTSGVLRNVGKIPQERYVKLCLDAFRQTSKLVNLSSFALYGSIARGTAGRDSDVDVLVVSNDFVGSMGSRIEMLCKVEEMVREELDWLRDHGVYTSLSLYPLREEEAERMPFLLLDLTEEAAILYDKGQFLERVLGGFKARLLKLGARRVFINKENWYWDLKPGYKFGEIIEI